MVAFDFKKIEQKWQKEWEKQKVFEAEIDTKKKKFFFTTPYPYISGSLHLGHGRAAIESDVYSRYLRMKGYNVLYPMAFHITGTPILGISSAIKNGDTNKIKLYEEYVGAYVKDSKKVKKIVQSFVDPQALVDFFIPKMVEEYKQLGLGVDWRRSFTSGDMEHQQMVKWQFEHYKEKNYLVKSKYPVLYSPEDESAMGEDDISDADSNPVEKTEFTLLKFKFNDVYLVAATLRPETIFGQTNLWINPTIKYIEANMGEETWVMSEEAFEKLSYQKKNIKKKGYYKGKLIGQHAVAPIINKKLLILPSRFVDADVGTGIVTSVPSDAPYDYIALRELQEQPLVIKKYGLNQQEIEDIEIIPIIKTDKYGDKAGVTSVEKAGVVQQDDPKLEQLTQEVYKEGFHSGVLLDVCGSYAGMKVKEAKETMKKDLIQKGFADIMYETSRKAFSRSGGKIIVAVLDNQWFLDFNAPGWKSKANECLTAMNIVPETFRRLFQDTFSWLDKRPCARRRGLGTPLPFDEQWIVESLSDSTIYMTLYTIQNLVKKYGLKREHLNHYFFDYVYLGKGSLTDVAKKTKVSAKILQEMRASFEYWIPIDHRHTFALHLSNHLSFMIFAFAGIFPKEYWPKKISFHGLIVSEGSKMSKSKGNVITLLHVKKNYGADIFRFYMTSSTVLEGTFDWKEAEAENAKSTFEKVTFNLDELTKRAKKGSVSDFYFSKFNSLKQQASNLIDAMKLREYNHVVVYDMLNFIRQARLSLNEKDLAALYEFIVDDWIALLAPVVPHIAEEYWNRRKNKGFVSVASWPKVDTSKINPAFDVAEQAVEKTVGDIMNVLRLVKEKTGEEGTQVYVYVLPKEVGNYAPDSLTKRVGKPVRVFAVNDPKKYDPQGKASKAKPGKPALFVE